MAAPASADQLKRDYRRWRIRIFFTCWTMYATYYLCRMPLSAAGPELKKLPWVGEGKLGLLFTAFSLAYGIGQLVNGLLGDRFGARKVGAIGMTISAVVTLIFGLAQTFPIMMAAWITNGLAQATGAPSRIKAFSNWFPPGDRGRMMGLLGTDYVVGQALSFLLSAWLLVTYGSWRPLFFVPAGLLLVSALHVALRLRNTPESVGLPPLEAMERGAPGAELTVKESEEATGSTATEEDDAGWSIVVKKALLNWRVWVVGVAYFGVDLFRYGFLFWAISFLVEAGSPVEKGIIKTFMMPTIGAVGIIASGWLSDHMGGRRAPVIAVMLFISAALAWAFYESATADPDGVLVPMVLLGAIGFFLYGPHLLMGATIAMDLGSRKASATASGVIDCLGYMGAAVAGVGTTWAKSLTGGDWSGAFYLWIGGVVVAGLLMLTLWNVKPDTEGEYV